MTGRTFEDGDMERRVQFLEKGFEKIDGKLDRLLDTLVTPSGARPTFVSANSSSEWRPDLVVSRRDSGPSKTGWRPVSAPFEARLERIDATLECKASAADVAEVRGMVRSLPTFVHMITLVFGILAGAFAILRYGLPHP